LVGQWAGARNVVGWVVALVILAVWMFPRHKLFDASLALILIAVIAWMIERPVPRRYFVAGLVVGLTATFGRNHGIYGVGGSLGAIFYLGGMTGWRNNFIPWGGGVIIGYAPVLLLLFLAPGFAASFWISIQLLFEQGATNLSLPIPWPWLVPFDRLTATQDLVGILTGLFFILLLGFGITGPIWLARCRWKAKTVQPVVAASICLGLPYAHYAFSRADVGHLALGIFPLIVGGLALLSAQTPSVKWIFGLLLAGASLFLMLPMHPGWQRRSEGNWMETEIGACRVKVREGIASDVALLGRLAAEFAPNGQPVLAVPFWPGAYAVLKRKAPLWEIYTAFHRDAAFQEEEIRRIEAAQPGFVMIMDYPLDGQEDRRYRNTHPLVDSYIQAHFTPLVGYTDNPAYQLFRNERTPP